jgi:MraZ protein
MLNGIYTYNVDQKGRIVMPGRFLEEIGNPFVLGGTPGGYLVAVSDPKRLDDHAGVRGFAECRIKDRTGRFVIPSALREFADLHQTGEAAVIGVGAEVEIWNKRRWESQAKPPFSGPSSPAMPSAAIVRQKALYGQPYLEVQGALTLGETDRVLTRLETALRGRPRTIFLDLRSVDTIDAAFLMAMEPIGRQLAISGSRLAILTERADVALLIERLCGAKYARVFTNLESSLWWLVDEGHA